jgi:DNA-binding NarL/FixJ family response regulator
MKSVKVTNQQAEYLADIASGMRLEDVARENHVAKETVSYQIRSLKNAIGAYSLPNLVAEGIRNKIIVSDGQGGYMSKEAHQIMLSDKQDS